MTAGWRRREFLRGAVAVATSVRAAVCVAADETSELTLEDFGGGARPDIDNVEPMRRALNAATTNVRQIVRVREGIYDFSSLALLQGGAIRRPSGVALLGQGAGRSIIRVVGGSVINHLFDASGGRDVITRGLTVIGNGLKDEAAPYAGGLMAAILSAGAAQDMDNLRWEDCEIRDFASAAWFNVENLSPARTIKRVSTRGCRWSARQDTAPGQQSILIPGHFIYINGARGPVTDVEVNDIAMDATHVKGGVALVGDVRNAIISVRAIEGVGETIENVDGAGDGVGCYAIMLYQNGISAPTNIAINIDRLDRARSVGVYSVGARRVTIRISEASGQRDTRDATLFKGVVAIMGGRDITVELGKISDCARVAMVSLDGGQQGTDARAANIMVSVERLSSRSGARDITVDAGVSPWAGGVRLAGARSGPAAVGVDLRAGPGSGLQDIDLSAFRNEGAQVAVILPERRRGRSRRVTLTPS